MKHVKHTFILGPPTEFEPIDEPAPLIDEGLKFLHEALAKGDPVKPQAEKFVMEDLDYEGILAKGVKYEQKHIDFWKSLKPQPPPKTDFIIKVQVEDAEGLLTKFGMKIAHAYAKRWVEASARDLNLEREFPALEGLFYDIRSDAELARRHASD